MVLTRKNQISISWNEEMNRKQNYRNKRIKKKFEVLDHFSNRQN